MIQAPGKLFRALVFCKKQKDFHIFPRKYSEVREEWMQRIHLSKSASFFKAYAASICKQ
jgi:hypothetical protein